MNLNCKTCGNGRQHWIAEGDGWRCPTCQGDPLKEGSGRADWKDFNRAKFVVMFGPRTQGDLELAKKYARELHGYDRAVPLESLVSSVVNRDRLGNEML